MSHRVNNEDSEQLRRPHGGGATEILDRMNRDNLSVIFRAIELLEIEGGSTVLEIGPGRAVHLDRILTAASDVRYVGLDWSEMVLQINAHLEKFQQAGDAALLCCGDASRLPFADGSFDRILAVNSLYFWVDIDATLTGIVKALGNEGRISLVFGERDFMERLPFTSVGFQLVDRDQVCSWLEKAGCTIEVVESFVSKSTTKSGRKVDVPMTIVVGRKQISSPGPYKTQ